MEWWSDGVVGSMSRNDTPLVHVAAVVLLAVLPPVAVMGLLVVATFLAMMAGITIRREHLIAVIAVITVAVAVANVASWRASRMKPAARAVALAGSLALSWLTLVLYWTWLNGV